MNTKPILKPVVAVFVGNLISISMDFLLSFLSPIIWLFFYPKYIGVIFGSLIGGFIVKARGWLIGVIISIIHCIYIFLLLYYPSEYVTEETSRVNWISLLPTGILLIIVGLIAGYCGEKIRRLKR
jgi:hypothetical protein